MYKYTINMPLKIENCTECPFRRQDMVFENVNSEDKLTGIICIHKRTSFCMIKNEPIFQIERVNGYESKCPLNNNVTYVMDEE